MKPKVDSNFKQPKMKLQVVFNFKRVWNEATSCFQFQSSQEWSNKLFTCLNESRMKLQVENLKQPEMKLRVVFNFKRVGNEGTIYFQLQSSQEWSNKLFTCLNESRMKLQVENL